jgi:hypothetical protein
MYCEVRGYVMYDCVGICFVFALMFLTMLDSPAYMVDVYQFMFVVYIDVGIITCSDELERQYSK